MVSQMRTKDMWVPCVSNRPRKRSPGSWKSKKSMVKLRRCTSVYCLLRHITKSITSHTEAGLGSAALVAAVT